MYRPDYAPAARKAIHSIRDVKLKRRIKAALVALREEPRPEGMKRLVGCLQIPMGDSEPV